nr:hypothetical protein [Trueperaceae bacterium]
MTSGVIVALAATLGLLASGAFVQVALRRSWGKAVRTDGPGGHHVKGGTPTMGGAAFVLVALLLALLVGPRDADAWALTALVLASAALGLLDDVLSLRRAHTASQPFADDEPAGERIATSTGLLARYRLFGQGVVGLLFAGYAIHSGVAVSGAIVFDVIFLAFVVVG